MDEEQSPMDAYFADPPADEAAEPAQEAAPDVQPEAAQPEVSPEDYQAATAKLAQYEEYSTLVQALRESGLDAQTALDHLYRATPQAAPEDPDAAFHASLLKDGIDPEELDNVTYQIAKRNFALEQRLDGMREAEQEREVRAARAEITAKLQTIEQEMPVFKGDVFRRSLLATYAMQVDSNPGITIDQVAKELHAAMSDWRTAELAGYQEKKAADAAAPVIAGGRSPAPVETLRTDMGREERLRAAESFLRTQVAH